MATFGNVTQPRPASLQEQQRVGEGQTKYMALVKRLLSGEKVEGVTPKLASTIMGMLGPDVMSAMAQRGHEINPNWYQNYIQPGQVNPNAYNQVMSYAAQTAMNTDLPSEMRNQAMQVYNEPTYQVGGPMANYQQQMMADGYTKQRMGMQGKMFDPHSNQWILDPKIQEAMAKLALANFDTDQSFEGFPQEVLDLLSPENRLYIENQGLTYQGAPSPGQQGAIDSRQFSAPPLSMGGQIGAPPMGTVGAMPPQQMQSQQMPPQQMQPQQAPPQQMQQQAPDTLEIDPNAQIDVRKIAEHTGSDPRLVLNTMKEIRDLYRMYGSTPETVQAFNEILRPTGLTIDLLESQFPSLWRQIAINLNIPQLGPFHGSQWATQDPMRGGASAWRQHIDSIGLPTPGPHYGQQFPWQDPMKK